MAQIWKTGLDGKANPKEDISEDHLNADAYKLAEAIILFLTFDLIKWIFIQK